MPRPKQTFKLYLWYTAYSLLILVSSINLSGLFMQSPRIDNSNVDHRNPKQKHPLIDSKSPKPQYTTTPTQYPTYNTSSLQKLQDDHNKKLAAYKITAFSDSQNKDRRPSYPFISGDGFRALCRYRCEGAGCNFSPTDLSPGDRIFISTTDDSVSITTKYLLLFSRLAPAIPHTFDVISHNGDLSAPDGDSWHTHDKHIFDHDFGTLLFLPNLRYWYASNCNCKTPRPAKVVCIPIGIENRYNPVGSQPQLYFSSISSAMQTTPTKTLLLSFTDSPIKPFRKEPLQVLSQNWVTRVATSRESWWQHVFSHRWIVCPFGHGLDTHRTWEVLLAKRFPVVLSSTLDQMYDDLPVLIVRDWREVNQSLLDQKYQEFSSRSFNWDKLFFAYWENLILGGRPR